jgi:DNA polymerase-3 subunit beta
MQLLHNVVPSRALLEILRNVKLVATNKERCTVMGTDLEVGIAAELPDTRVQEAGEALLPAGRFLAILREATDDELSIEADTQSCIVRGHSSRFTLGSEDPAKFPDVPIFAAEDYHELAAGTLREMIDRTLFAAAIEHPRFALAGVLWELEGEQARLIGANGRCLAVARGSATPHGHHDTNGRTHVVPSKGMKLLERNLQNADERVRVSLRPNEALFKTERATIYTRLVEGRYPPYQEVFPKKQTVKIPLGVGAFYTAVRQAAVVTDDETRRVVFSFAKKKLTLQIRGKTDEAKVEIPIDYTGKAVDIAFDPKFLTGMLRRLDSQDVVTAELVDGNTVGLFRRGDDYAYLVVPMAGVGEGAQASQAEGRQREANRP